MVRHVENWMNLETGKQLELVSDRVYLMGDFEGSDEPERVFEILCTDGGSWWKATPCHLHGTIIPEGTCGPTVGLTVH